LTEAEQHDIQEPRTDVTRTTASALYHRPAAGMGVWATTLTWGRNSSDDDSTNAFLVETDLPVTARDSLFGRFEVVQKTGSDLVLRSPTLEHETFVVSKLHGGYERELSHIGSLVPGVGGSLSISLVPDRLEPFYGGKASLGVAIFVSLRPAIMQMMQMPAAP